MPTLPKLGEAMCARAVESRRGFLPSRTEPVAAIERTSPVWGDGSIVSGGSDLGRHSVEMSVSLGVCVLVADSKQTRSRMKQTELPPTTKLYQ